MRLLWTWSFFSSKYTVSALPCDRASQHHPRAASGVGVRRTLKGLLSLLPGLFFRLLLHSCRRAASGQTRPSPFPARQPQPAAPQQTSPTTPPPVSSEPQLWQGARAFSKFILPWVFCVISGGSGCSLYPLFLCPLESRWPLLVGSPR